MRDVMPYVFNNTFIQANLVVFARRGEHQRQRGKYVFDTDLVLSRRRPLVAGMEQAYRGIKEMGESTINEMYE